MVPSSDNAIPTLLPDVRGIVPSTRARKAAGHAVLILVKPGFGFRPELIAITTEAVDLNRATDYGPKSACAGFVPQISRVIYGAGKNALPRRFDEALAVWRPEAIGGPAHERFDSAHFGAA
jgi:hypothetical protein